MVKMKTKTNLSSQYRVTSIQNLRPSRLSTGSLQSKIYDPLVSVHGHFNPKFTTLSSQYKVKIKKKMTLSSQYKVTSIQNLRPSRLNTRSKWRITTLSSQYKVISIQNLRPSRLSTRSKLKKNDPLVSVQGHSNPNFTTLSSQYKVKMKTKTTLSSQYRVTSIQNLRPSHLSTGSLQSKIYDPLVSVQGQNKKKKPSRLGTRSKWRTTTLSS